MNLFPDIIYKNIAILVLAFAQSICGSYTLRYILGSTYERMFSAKKQARAWALMISAALTLTTLWIAQVEFIAAGIQAIAIVCAVSQFHNFGTEAQYQAIRRCQKISAGASVVIITLLML